MKNTVTVINDDSIIGVDGEFLRFEFNIDADIHAIQWNNGSGFIEYKSGPSLSADYEKDVLPFVMLWEQEKTRIEEELKPKPLTLEQAKLNKIDEINNITSTKITEGFWYQDDSFMLAPLHFSFDLEDQANFSSTMNGANLYFISQVATLPNTIPDTISWNGYTDIAHTQIKELIFTAEQFITFWGYAEVIHKNGLLTKARDLKKLVDLAESIERVESIVWV